VVLGAGRGKAEDKVDFGAGLMLAAKLGDRLEKGAPLATIYSSDKKKLAEGVKMFMSAVEVKKSKPSRPKLIKEILV